MAEAEEHSAGWGRSVHFLGECVFPSWALHREFYYSLYRGVTRQLGLLDPLCSETMPTYDLTLLLGGGIFNVLFESPLGSFTAPDCSAPSDLLGLCQPVSF